MTITLTDFLLARIDEDARDASLAAADRDARITVTGGGISFDRYREVGGKPAAADHVERWVPARVLAECEAKRRIVEAAKFVERVEGGGAEIVMFGGYARDGITGVLVALARVYADHPNYREEWRA